jgi:hypothetical protein
LADVVPVAKHFFMWTLNLRPRKLLQFFQLRRFSTSSSQVIVICELHVGEGKKPKEAQVGSEGNLSSASTEVPLRVVIKSLDFRLRR